MTATDSRANTSTADSRNIIHCMSPARDRHPFAGVPYGAPNVKSISNQLRAVHVPESGWLDVPGGKTSGSHRTGRSTRPGEIRAAAARFRKVYLHKLRIGFHPASFGEA